MNAGLIVLLVIVSAAIVGWVVKKFLVSGEDSVEVHYDPEQERLAVETEIRKKEEVDTTEDEEQPSFREEIDVDLEEVKGIGPATKSDLLEAFGDIRSIHEASDEELLEYLSETRLSRLRDYLNEKAK